MAGTASSAAVPQFTHVLLTRFNVATNYADPCRGLDEEWLRHRVQLFMNYCWPSIQAQDEKRFSWLLFCHADSPAWFRDHMASLAPGCNPVYVDGVVDDRVYGRAIEQLGLASAPYLITTRLDNDDALSSSYVRRVQQAFVPHPQQFLLFPIGMQLYRGHLYSLCWLDNPFYSMTEAVPRSGGLKTVLCCRHGDIYKTAPVRRIWGSSKWLEVIHERNVSNSLRGWPRLASRRHPAFPALQTTNAPSDSLLGRAYFASARLRKKLGRLGQRVPASA